MRSEHPSPVLSSISRSALPLVLALAAGCASAPKKGPAAVWPPPPDVPRVEYVEKFSGPDDFETSGWSRFRRAVLGRDDVPPVFGPTGMALTPDEKHLYVVSPTKRLVHDFDLENRKVGYAIPTTGPGPKMPYGVAVDEDGRIYVSDRAGGEVWVFATDGKVVAEIGVGMLKQPVGVAVDRRGKVLYVADSDGRGTERHVVEVFSLDGRHLRTLGSAGQGPGQFLFPAYLAVGPDGSLYVGDGLNSRVQVFDREGTLLTMFGRAGTDVGAIGRVKGIALDAFGNIHVADALNRSVQIFGPDYKLLVPYAFPLPEPAPRIQFPSGIVITSTNEIFLADYADHVVHHLRLVNTKASDSRPAGGDGSVAPDASAPPPPAPAAIPRGAYPAPPPPPPAPSR